MYYTKYSLNHVKCLKIRSWASVGFNGDNGRISQKEKYEIQTVLAATTTKLVFGLILCVYVSIIFNWGNVVVGEGEW